MKRTLGIALAGLAWVLAAGTVRAEDPEPSVVEEILGVLQERGLVDQAEHDRLVARYQAQEKSQQSALPRIRMYGDLRLRGEGFWYDQDPVAGHTPDRYRGRYRLRLNLDSDVTSFAMVHVQLGSGENDSRSANTSFGQTGPDFNPDAIFINQADVRFTAPSSWLPVEGGSASLEIGKVANPFLWNKFRDKLLWDDDINPEGFAARIAASPYRDLDLFFNGGYFIDQENAGAKDPYLMAAQLGGTYRAGESVEVGARATWYGFRALDANFLCRGANGKNCNGSAGSTSGGGNILDGLTGSPNGGSMDVAELAAYLTWSGLEDWPVTVWGDVANNFSAASSQISSAGSDSLAWSTGLVLGDKTKVAEVGAAYLWLQANAFPSQFVESDWIDGETNHRSLTAWITRRLFANIDFTTLLSFEDTIDDSLPTYSNSVGKAKRIRLQTDLSLKF
jgi:hypothetical protein